MLQKKGTLETIKEYKDLRKVDRYIHRQKKRGWLSQ